MKDTRNWNKLLSAVRFGKENETKTPDAFARTQFQRDYDRIIFSSPFRRLQNKTQVFPLPGSVLVHNRLTHSLEVASVGRSLGSMISAKIFEANEADFTDPACLVGEIGTIVATACLAHDLGNPAFGHSGEKAISLYFKEGEGRKYQTQVSEAEWFDLINFEGNANTLRILTHPFKGKGTGGFDLTYATLAALIKYPCESSKPYVKGQIHTKKYGFFQSEKTTFEKITQQVPFHLDEKSPLVFKRHPLVYLVEAADDICYIVIDVEDAHRLHILSEQETKDLLLPLIASISGKEKADRYNRWLEEYSEPNDRIAFLRAVTINQLTQACTEIFWQNRLAILDGEFATSLTDALNPEAVKCLKEIESVSVNKIYNFPASVEIELAGYKVMGDLLATFIPAVIEPKSHYAQKLLMLIPDQFKHDKESAYAKIQTVLDFVSGMTDLYAVELYRKIKGIEFPTLK